MIPILTNQDEFEKYLILQYFRYGSINKVFSAHRYDLPISFAGYARTLTKYQVIKSAGPNSNLSESLFLLQKLANYKIPLERLYHQYAPKKLQVSTNTLHRILHYTRLGLTRRQGVALIITRKSSPNEYLMGQDLTLSDPELGQKGDLSLPMGHSKINEEARDSIGRVLQQEVFTNKVINKEFPSEIIPTHPKPICYIQIADILVSVYHLELIRTYEFSSFKLSKIRFYSDKEISREIVRPGVIDILNLYKKLVINPEIAPKKYPSKINLTLHRFATLPAKNSHPGDRM